jgi:hypothetical protein
MRVKADAVRYFLIQNEGKTWYRMRVKADTVR